MRIVPDVGPARSVKRNGSIRRARFFRAFVTDETITLYVRIPQPYTVRADGLVGVHTYLQRIHVHGFALFR